MGCRAEATAVTEVTTGDPRGRVKSRHTVAQVARPAHSSGSTGMSCPACGAFGREARGEQQHKGWFGLGRTERHSSTVTLRNHKYLKDLNGKKQWNVSSGTSGCAETQGKGLGSSEKILRLLRDVYA